jgi:ferritin
MNINKIIGRIAGAEQTKFLSEEMVELLAKQVGNEMQAAYIYTAMAVWLDGMGMSGYCAWMQKQAGEEMKHAEKVLHHLMTSGAEFELPAIEPPQATYSSVIEVAEATLEHEKGVTEDWKTIASVSSEDGDYATEMLAEWFVTEQMEEEDTALKVYQRFALAGDGSGLLLIDQELGKR